MNLSGKVMAVTGSDGALGRAVATALGRYGATLALIPVGRV
jgi:NAD(P)-dependent dehydrogenase (short-subunit alcohol dehydrogenase family)